MSLRQKAILQSRINRREKTQLETSSFEEEDTKDAEHLDSWQQLPLKPKRKATNRELQEKLHEARVERQQAIDAGMEVPHVKRSRVRPASERVENRPRARRIDRATGRIISDVRRDICFSVSCSRREMDEVRELARRAGMNLSEWVRSKLFT